ncbi:MAG: Gfo/Idh/MocA family oxidoreductase [Myxococcales bacterium]|nr:Gfo/Idh/MocA family oxidoreductase [Myxococcales bacterium]
MGGSSLSATVTSVGFASSAPTDAADCWGTERGLGTSDPPPHPIMISIHPRTNQPHGMIFMLIATADIPIPLAGGIQRVKNFALIGAGGYIAPRHLKAIHDTGNRLIAAADPNDSVGVLDQYFPHTRFFTEIERFDRFVEKLRREKSPDTVNYVSVCSPNYLHDAHVRLGLRIHADVICEKPLVLSPWNIDALAQLEQEFGRRIYTVLQLRLLPSLIALKHTLESETSRKRASVDLRYITPRGPWYEVSLEDNDRQSGRWCEHQHSF